MIISDKDTRIPTMCKKIAEMSKTEEELDRRLGMLVCDELLEHDIKYQPLPEKPQALVAYSNMSKDQKFKFDRDNPDWRKSPTYQQYLNDLSAAETSNESNVYWLKYWAKCVDEDRAEKFRRKLLEFQVRMPESRIQIQTNVKVDKPTQDVIDMFGGSIVKGV